MTPERAVAPRIGGAVLVSHFDRHHVVHTAVAHVLAISGGTHLSTPDGAPALTVAFPDPAADPTVLQGPNFSRGYRREVGVVHHSHPEAQAGRHSIVWGHAFDEGATDQLLDGPKHSAENPIYKRHQPETNLAEIPQGLHGAPRLRSEDEPVADGSGTGRYGGHDNWTFGSDGKRYPGSYGVGDTGFDADGNPLKPFVPFTENAQQQNIDATGNVVETREYPEGFQVAERRVPLQPVAENVDRERIKDASLLHDPARIPVAPEPAQDSAIDAADENAHNAEVAAEVADKAADDAASNADVVHDS